MVAQIHPLQANSGFSNPLFSNPGIIPVVYLFTNGSWRLSRPRQILLYFALRLNIYYFIWDFFRFIIWLAIHVARLLGFANFLQGVPPSLKNIVFRVTIAILKEWPNDFVASIWWDSYHVLAEQGDFEMNYLAAWRHKFKQSSTSAPASHDVHLYVENSYLRAPIPVGLDDAATLRALKMWYCMIRSNMGLSEAFLLKRLSSIDRIETRRRHFRPVKRGNRIKSLLGSSKNSHISLFNHPETVKGQRTVKDQIAVIIQNEGLEFVRSWNTVAMSAIVMLPFLLSIIFASVWVGIFIRRGTDIQIAVQTAFPVASCIVTAGALFIALVTFVDAQASKESDQEISPQQLQNGLHRTISSTSVQLDTRAPNDSDDEVIFQQPQHAVYHSSSSTSIQVDTQGSNERDDGAFVQQPQDGIYLTSSSASIPASIPRPIQNPTT